MVAEDGVGGKVIVYEVDQSLSKKVLTGMGKTRDEMIAQADSMVAAMKQDYLQQLDQALADLTQALADYRDGDQSENGAWHRMYRIGHEQRGLGGTFGYDLASQICDALCSLLERATPAQPKIDASIETHVTALSYVAQNRIEGGGDAGGRKLVGQLWRLVEKVGGPPAEPPVLAGGNAPGLEDALSNDPGPGKS